MLNARAIYRLLIDDEQPAQPPDDPRQMALDFNPDDLLDPKAEIMRYAKTPFRIPGTGPTSTYQHFQDKLAGTRVRKGQRRKKLQNNTYLIDYGNRIAVRYHQTDVVTAYPDGKVVVDAGGWHPQGDKANYGWRAPAGTTTRDRIGYMAGTAGGWDIYQKNYVWYWYNRDTGAGNWKDTVRYPYTDGDTIFPDGSLQLQAQPEARDTIQLVAEGKAPEGWSTTRGVYANLSKWPREVEYYVKCPKCGLVHGSFKKMADAHAKKLCDLCNLTAINDLKDEIQNVIHDPKHEPKEMSKLMGEAIDRFDPFDETPEGHGQEPTPVPPEDLPPEPEDTRGEIERLLLGNWVDVALREFCEDQHYDLSDLEIDENWGQGDYDSSDPDATTRFKVNVGNEEWLFFKSEDEAESYALEIVRNDLKSEPEIFSQDWLRQFVDEDRLRNAIGDPYEEWENDVRDLDYEDLLDKMVEEGYVENDDPVFFKKNGDKRIENPVRVKALNKIMEDFIEKEKPSWEPWDWLEDVYGKEEAQKQAIEMVGIDVDKAATDAVATDGWPHFVARYDGNAHSLENGGTYCRIN